MSHPNALDRLVSAVSAALQTSSQFERIQGDGSAVTRVRDVVERAIETFAQSRSLIACLPPELLISVLGYLDFKGQINASHVSRAWRMLSLSHPAKLWSFVRSDYLKSTPGTLLAVLERSGEAPLSLEIEVKENNVFESAIALSKHLNHMRRLVLWLDTALSHTAIEQLRSAIAHSAPILHTVVLWDQKQIFDPGSGSVSGWFAGDAPRLQRLKLYCDPSIVLTINAYSSVTRLLYSPHVANDSLALALAQILPEFPVLRTLAIEVKAHDVFMSEFTSDVIMRLNNLESVALVTQDEKVVLPGAWVAVLTTPTACLVWNEVCVDESGVRRSIHTVLDRLSAIEHMTIHYSEGINIDVRDTHGRERTFLEVPVTARPGPECFVQLTSLAVSELAWSIGDLLPAAPALQSLTIYLLRPWSHAISRENGRTNEEGLGHASAFLLPPSRARALVARRLRSLAFVARAPTSWEHSFLPTIVDPMLIREFMRYQLVYDRVLDVLAFRGVTFCTSCEMHVSQIARLFTYARIIDIDPRTPSDSRPINDLLTWGWP